MAQKEEETERDGDVCERQREMEGTGGTEKDGVVAVGWGIHRHTW